MSADSSHRAKLIVCFATVYLVWGSTYVVASIGVHALPPILFGGFRFLCAGVLLAPATVSAQTGIAGVVRDTTGAIMPGVTVEASSPALIEKSRVAISDSAGQYKIVDLPPGTYAVTFSLAGFKSVKRTDILLEGTFTAQINADLQVGAMEETLTVHRLHLPMQL